MPSQARIDAGRRNGMLARGKKSEEARQKCAQNSLKHGLFSETLVLSNEDPGQFESIRKCYYEVWKPENEFEADLVYDMVAARWRINRIMMTETETLNLRQGRMDQSGEIQKEFEVIQEPTRLAVAFNKECNESKTLANLSRYEARYYRQLRNATAELRRVQKDRRASEAEEADAIETEAIASEPQPKRKNEGNAIPKPAPPILEIVRPSPAMPSEPAAQPSDSAPEDDPTRS